MSRGRRIARIKLIHPSRQTAEKYLLEWESKDLHYAPEDFPRLTGQNLFGGERLFSLDIGCGTGEYVNALASAHPERLFVGVEVSRRAIYYAINTAAERRLDNIRFIKADFRLLTPLFAPNTLDQVYLTFPDPNYGGSKNLGKRLFNRQFLDLMSTALSPQGSILVVTDQEPFLYDMLELAESDARFKKPHEARYLMGFSPPEKTRFQMAWEKFNHPVFRFILNRKS